MAHIVTLVGSSSFISASGKLYSKGINYTVSPEEAKALLGSKDDYEVPYFGVVASSADTQEAKVVSDDPVPTTEEVAKSINDPAPSNSTAEQGELDTATETTRRVGRPPKSAVAV